MKKKVNKKPNKEEKDKALESLQMERFCVLYLNGLRRGRKYIFKMGNATLSYIEAYELKKSQYDSASASASRLLRSVKIKNRLRKMIEDSGFNDEAVDNRLTQIITNGSDKDSNVAIKTFNELTKRIDKVGYIIPVDIEKKAELNKALEFLHGRK